MQRIAIIGIGCRFPGGVDSAASYWSLLGNGRCAIGEIPAGRWALPGFYDATSDLPNRSYSKWGGFLDDISGFDAAYFGLSPREAEAMDPQQRLLLQVACEAADDARLPLAALRRAATGVFIGVSNIDYGLLQRYRPGQGDIQAGTGTALSIVANRVSNRLDLAGPSMGIDTACSSSLVAVDTACRHLSDGSCGMALAGGVNILLDSRMFITFSRAHMLSPTGRIRAFDAAADGFVRGEGAGVVVLRRLDDALAAGDRIYAVIEATAINQDGRTGTITEPSRTAQTAMLEAVLARAGIAPADVAYVEAHGTGTPVGDPIEANAIGAVLGGKDRRGPLLIGSAKTNIGHLEPAAGIAGFIKAALVLHHAAIPPSLGFEQPSPAIAFDELNLDVVREMQALPGDGRAGHALVNSFGFGGTNACAVLSAATAPTVRLVKRSAPQHVPARRVKLGRATLDPACEPSPIPVPISAPTLRHLQAFAATLAKEIESGCLADHTVTEIAAALAVQRDHHEHRAVIIALTPVELAERLRCLADDREWPQAERHAPPQNLRGRARAGRKLCFTMTGQGGQWWAMGRDLLEREPVFRETVEQFDSVFAPIGGWSIMEALLADEATSRIDDAAITPAVMFAFQTALSEVWRARGVVPDMLLGHSFGEVTAAFLAGGLEATEIARLVNQRGLIRHSVDRVGTMAAIGLGASAIEPMLPAGGSIEIGGYNAPDMVTLTGEEAAIDRLIAQLNASDPTILTRKLALDFAYHSSWFEPVEQTFKDQVGTLRTAPPRLPVVSTVTGRLNDRFDTDYWWQNLRRPVRYSQGVETALDLGADVFVELGPHRTLSSMTTACAVAKGREIVTVTTLDRRWGDLVSLATGTGQLYAAGVEIDWTSLLGEGGRGIELPRQPWDNQPLWQEPDEALHHLRPSIVHPLLGRAEAGPGRHWSCEVSLAAQPWLGDHRLDGNCVFPAAAYLEMLTVAARTALAAEAVELVDVAFPSALYIGGDDEVQLATRFEPDRRKLTIHSRVRGSGPDWVLRVSATAFVFDAGFIGAGSGDRVPGWERDGQRHAILPGAVPLDVVAFYRDALSAGYGWGRQFQGLTAISKCSGSARGEIAVASLPASDGGKFHLDPRLVDSALQLMLASGDETEIPGMMPVGIERMVVTASPGRTAVALGRTRVAATGGGSDADIDIALPGGSSVVRIEGLQARRRSKRDEGTHGRTRLPRFYRETTEAISVSAKEAPREGAWIIVSQPDCRHAQALRSKLSERGATYELVEAKGDASTAVRDAIDRLRTVTSGARTLGIVHASPLSIDAIGPGEIGTAAIAATQDMIGLGRTVSEVAADGVQVELVLVTRGARAGHPGEAIDNAGLAQSPVLAVARTIAMEVPGLGLQLIDCDPHALEDMAVLLDVLTSAPTETEIAIRAGVVLALRLDEMGRDGPPPPRARVLREGSTHDFALRHTGAAGPDGLHWREVARRDVGPGDVEVEVAAAGLNFRDLMAVSGLLPAGAEADPALGTLGLELSGVVRGIGTNVHDLAPGDRVLGMGRGALRRFVVVPRAALARTPGSLSHPEAAAIPSAYMTAHYALDELARLQPGETVLIQSATGGVGLAAIALARRVKARIIATAGSPERRAHLHRLGIAHAFDSRGPGFAEDVMRATNGLGVDVVLNALSGPLIEKGLACLAPYGRFIELGKKDVYENAAVGLKALKSNISFHVVDLAALITERPVMATRMLDEVLAMLAADEIKPLPFEAYAAGASGDAFRRFASGKHLGKLVINLEGAQVAVRSALAGGAPLDPEGTYLVTGGTRGFGLAVGRWLAARGAGRVVLASRSGAISRDAAVDTSGAMETLRLDVTSAGEVEAAVTRLSRAEKPLRGIVHAAVAYDDARLAGMDTARIDRVLAPKIAGALNLTRAVEACAAALDHFVTFSSLAQVAGWPGQSNYAAANGFLEALASWQRARGIPGQCINWGAFGESGHVADRPQMQGYLDSSGWIAIDNAAALDAFARALDIDLPSVTVAAVDWQRLAATQPALARSTRLSRLLVRDGNAGRSTRGFDTLEGDALMTAALELVRRQAARVLRARAEEVLPGQTLAEAGIDSLSSFELHNRLEQEAGFEVPMPSYTKARRILDLAELLSALATEGRSRAAENESR